MNQGNKKVKITKYSNEEYWYKGLVGNTYEVIDYDAKNKKYRVNNNGSAIYFIDLDDCTLMAKECQDDYTISCYSCGIIRDLAMVAHRKEGKIVGWLFACGKCFEKVKGLDFGVIDLGKENRG